MNWTFEDSYYLAVILSSLMVIGLLMIAVGGDDRRWAKR